MQRNEIQEKTGLTRKAIEYYEEKGIIVPQKSENGYRDYSEKDLEVLMKVSLYRKLGLNLAEIKEVMMTNPVVLSSILRKKEIELEFDQKRKEIFKLMIQGDETHNISEKISELERSETIFHQLQQAFPGYLGQFFFASYQPFLDHPIDEKGFKAYTEYVNYLDSLPDIEFSAEEKAYLEHISSNYDLSDFKKINEDKMTAINHVEEWFSENEDIVQQYEDFKKSEAYLSSPIYKIQAKLKSYLIENQYYEKAIPLLRQFSPSYNQYYLRLLEADEKYRAYKSESIETKQL